MSEPTLDERDAGLPTTSFGRYRLQRVLGTGGMGVVYRAWDPQLARAVAIKVVKHAHADDAIRARLVKEAQSLARLSHPNVCHVYDVGTEGDEVWVAMELIEGQTLRTWAERHSATELVAALVAAAEGLEAAHAAGIIHRDVKPENVLVANDGRAVVTDFGLARVDDHVDAIGSTVSGDANATIASVDGYATASGVVAGTPAYLAPEQLTGAPLDPRVDQFAWAVMAWELVTGLRPFPIVAGARLDAIRAGLTPPPTMPRTLAAVLSRALAAAPRDRFPSMRALLDALTAPAPAPPRSRAMLAVGALVALVALLAIVGVVAWQLRDDDPPAPKVVIVPADAAGAIAGADAAPITAIVEPDAARTTATDAAAIGGPVDAAIAIVTRDAGQRTSIVDAAVAAAPIDASFVALLPDAEVESAATPTDAEQLAQVAPIPREVAESVFESMCVVPADPTAAGLDTFRDLDWGRVTQRVLHVGTIGQRMKKPMILYEVKGQRKTYRFDGFDDSMGSLIAEIGDLVVLCPDGTRGSLFTVPVGWEQLTAMQAFLRVSAPPRITAYAKLAPVWIKSGTPTREADYAKLEHPAGGHYLLRGKATGHTGTRWAMENRWFLEVPPGIPGAKEMSTTKSAWFVVTGAHFDGDALVYRAEVVITEMFPP